MSVAKYILKTCRTRFGCPTPPVAGGGMSDHAYKSCRSGSESGFARRETRHFPFKLLSGFSSTFGGFGTRPTILLGVMALFFAFFSCGNNQEAVKKEPPPVAVKVALVNLSDEEIAKTYTGTLEGEKQAVLYAKIAEAVEEVHVREGQWVKADQVFISLDKAGPSSRYHEALSRYQNAEKNYKKMEYLFAEGAVSESRFDAAKTEYETTKAAFEAAEQLVEVRSPIDGIVTSLNVSKGDYLNPSQELATIATVDKLRVKIGVKASDVGDIEQGAQVVVSSEGASHRAEGSVVSVAHSADPSTRTFQVEVIIDNSNGVFKPGMFVRIDVALSQLTDVVAVSRGAVIARRGSNTVFVVSNGVARQRRVSLGDDLGGRVVVTSGLSVGDTLITVGQDYLQDGFKVNVVDIDTDGQ